MAPWKRLSKGFAPAKMTLLLDYVSPANVMVLPIALKARDLAVATVIISSLLIKTSIVISTGLFIRQDQLVEHRHARLLATDKFDATAFSGSSIDTRPYLNVFGIAHLNQSYPAGTTDQYAFQSVNSSYIADGEYTLYNFLAAVQTHTLDRK